MFIKLKHSVFCRGTHHPFGHLKFYTFTWFFFFFLMIEMLFSDLTVVFLVLFIQSKAF